MPDMQEIVQTDGGYLPQIGFVASFRHGKGRITAVADGSVTEFLPEDCDQELLRTLNLLKYREQELRAVQVFYLTSPAESGAKARGVAALCDGLTEPHLKALSERLVLEFSAWPGEQRRADIELLCHFLEPAGWLTGDTVAFLVSSVFGSSSENRRYFARALPVESVVRLVAELDLAARWDDQSDDQFRQTLLLSEMVLAPDDIATLREKRHAIEREAAREREAAKAEEDRRRKSEQQGVNRKLVEDLRLRFREDRTELRNERRLAHVCLRCGDHAGWQTGFQRCLSCGLTWYSNECWNCGARVDDRDPKTPHCSLCKWCTCADCGACDEDGCETNPHSKAKRDLEREKRAAAARVGSRFFGTLRLR